MSRSDCLLEIPVFYPNLIETGLRSVASSCCQRWGKVQTGPDQMSEESSETKQSWLLDLVVGGWCGNEDSVMWFFIAIRHPPPPPHSLFSPDDPLTMASLSPTTHPQGRAHLSPRNQLAFLLINLTPGSSYVTVGATKVSGCALQEEASSWLHLSVVKCCMDSIAGSLVHCHGKVLGPGFNREAAFGQVYRKVGWRRINKVWMTVSSSPLKAWRRFAGAGGCLASWPSRVRLRSESFHPGGGE